MANPTFQMPSLAIPIDTPAPSPQLAAPQLQVTAPGRRQDLTGMLVPMGPSLGPQQPLQLAGAPPPALASAQAQQQWQLGGAPQDLRPLFAGQAQAAATPAPVDPSKLATGRAPQQGQGGAPGAAPGSDYLTEWNNIVDQQKRELLRRPMGGGFVRPKAPEPLLRMGALQEEAGKIEGALATFDRDLNYRKADNAGDLVAEQQAGIKRLEELDAQNAARMAEAQKSLDAATSALATGEYDHDRLWHKASDGKRAGFMVASVLAGIGQSIAGQGGQQNRAMSTLFQLMDRDNEGQIKAIETNRAKASDAAKLYRDVAEKTGSDRAAVHALNVMKLDALKSQFEAEYQKLATDMPIAGTKVDLQYGTPYVVDAKTGQAIPGAVINAQGVPVDPRTKRPLPGARVEVPTTGTGQPLPTTALDLRLQQAKNAIGQRRAQEELALQQAIAAATKPVGGGGMTNEQRLAKLAALTKGQVEAQREANKDAAAQGKDAPNAIFVGGQKMMIDPNAPKEAAFDAQKKINMADMGLKTIDAVGARLKNAPEAGYLEKGARMVGLDRLANAVADEGRLIGTDQMTALASQLSGAGVPSEVQTRLFQQLFAGGPGADAALGEMRRILNQGKQITIQGVGVK